jgi:hypothetical protein
VTLRDKSVTCAAILAAWRAWRVAGDVLSSAPVHVIEYLDGARPQVSV